MIEYNIYIYIYIYIYKTTLIQTVTGKLKGFFIMMVFFFYQNGVHLKIIINLGKSCQFGTTSYAQIVPIWHDSVMS